MLIKDKIRILHIIESLGPGGAERALLTNLTFLDKDKFYNVVAYLYKDEFFLSDLKEIRIKAYPLSLKNIYQPFAAISGLVKIIKSEKIDIVHTNLFGADIYGRIAAKLAGVPVVTTLHNLGYKRSSIFNKRKILDIITSRLSGCSFIAVSNAVKRSTEQQIGIKGIKVICNSIDIDKFTPLDEKERISVRNRLGIEKDACLLTDVGRLDFDKGHNLLLKALSLEGLKSKNFVLLLAGDGPAETQLKDLCMELGIQEKVKFLGRRSDIRDIVGCSDLFILPTINEGFGIVILEAMALKIPCVASDIDGIKEIIDNDVNGILAQPAPIALSEAISRIIKDENKKMRITDSAYIKVTNNFNIKGSIKKLEDIYMDLYIKR